MEQLIFFIVIYFIYWLFSSIARKARQQQQQQQRPLPRPPVSRPAQTQPGETEVAEPEIPPFLREIFGLEKPEPEVATPLPEAAPESDVRAETFSYETAPIPSVRQREPLMPEKKAPPRVLFGMETGPEPARSTVPTLDLMPGKQLHTRLDDLLRGKQNLRNAFILKEILDAPLHRRSQRLPFSPR